MFSNAGAIRSGTFHSEQSEVHSRDGNYSSMTLQPNEIARRSRVSSGALVVGFLLLLGAFFKTQVIQKQQYLTQSEENRLRPIPVPAPRGIIYDRHGNVIAENLPGYSVSVTAPNVNSLRDVLAQLAPTLEITQNEINLAVRRYRRAPTRPTVILPDASIDVVSVLEEHRLDFPGLIIQSVPKRYYPDGSIVRRSSVTRGRSPSPSSTIRSTQPTNPVSQSEKPASRSSMKTFFTGAREFVSTKSMLVVARFAGKAPIPI
jgi:cell division protein FtsI/penicillin-binding protein 2